MATGTSRQLLSASTLTGDEIRNFQDEQLGSVHDLMIDCENGRVGYVVMTSGGFLGMGNKLFAIPMSALQVDPGEKCLRMNASKQTFENAQGFDKNNWPDMANRQWERSVHGHFGATPYWE
jgi:hypothetical protein